MRTNYVPVISNTFVNTSSNSFRTVKLSTHNTPTVTVRSGRLGRSGSIRRIVAESREEARERFESLVERFVDNGFVQVA